MRGSYFLHWSRKNFWAKKEGRDYVKKKEMEDLQDDSDFLDSPEIWSGRNYGTADHTKYLTSAGNNYFCSFVLLINNS